MHVTHKDQFLLTSLPFNRRPFCSNHFELCNIMRVGRNISCLQLWEVLKDILKQNIILLAFYKLKHPRTHAIYIQLILCKHWSYFTGDQQSIANKYAPINIQNRGFVIENIELNTLFIRELIYSSLNSFSLTKLENGPHSSYLTRTAWVRHPRIQKCSLLSSSLWCWSISINFKLEWSIRLMHINKMIAKGVALRLRRICSMYVFKNQTGSECIVRLNVAHWWTNT
jgi:hypothetical protein